MTIYKCPVADEGPSGCGATFWAEPDAEDLVDCPQCGMWFVASAYPCRWWTRAAHRIAYFLNI